MYLYFFSVNSSFLDSCCLMFGKDSIRACSFWLIASISSGVSSTTLGSLYFFLGASSKSSSVKISFVLSLLNSFDGHSFSFDFCLETSTGFWICFSTFFSTIVSSFFSSYSNSSYSFYSSSSFSLFFKLSSSLQFQSSMSICFSIANRSISIFVCSHSLSYSSSQS